MSHKQPIPTWLTSSLLPNGHRASFSSAIQFSQAFNTDEKCLQYLVNLKWGSKGWLCPKCGNNEYSFITTRYLIKCKKCHYQGSFIANTIMRKTRKSLVLWFHAIWFIATHKMGISAVELKRHLGLKSYQTAWAWLHKIMLIMVEKNRGKLRREVEVDEGYIFTGKKKKKGRGLKGTKKKLVICAVECVPGRKEHFQASGKARLRSITGATSKNLEAFVKDHVEKGATVHTDGWAAYLGLSSIGFHHVPHFPETPKDSSLELPRVHRIFSNLKVWLKNTHKYVSGKHLQNYLNEFIFRFDLRWNPLDAFNYVLYNAVLEQPRIYRQFVRHGRIRYVNPLTGLPKYVAGVKIL